MRSSRRHDAGVVRLLDRQPWVSKVRRWGLVIDAARLMVGYGIRHVPVVSDDGRVIGMVSARDVLRVLVDEIETNTSKARSR